MKVEGKTCREANSNLHSITYIHKMIYISVRVHSIKLRSMLGNSPFIGECQYITRQMLITSWWEPERGELVILIVIYIFVLQYYM